MQKRRLKEVSACEEDEKYYSVTGESKMLTCF